MLSGPLRRGDPADDACRHDTLGHRRRARQRVGTAAGETDDGHLVDAQRVGDGAQVIGELEDVLVLVAASTIRCRVGRYRSAGCPPLRRRPAPRWGSACGRPGCRAARTWRDPAERRTRRTRSGDPRRRRCFLRASGDRLRQPCPKCRMPAVTLCRASDIMAHHGVMADDELDELFRVRPEEFTALRTELAAAAKKRGDAAAAKRISAARKPTTAAWVVNLLVHTNDDVKQSLTDLGERLRARARRDGWRCHPAAVLRATVACRRTRARRVRRRRRDEPVGSAARGRHRTLQAAVADPDVAARLGRLSQGRTVVGLRRFRRHHRGIHRCPRRATPKPEPKPTRDKPAARRARGRAAEPAREVGGGEGGVGGSRARQRRRRRRIVGATNDLAVARLRRDEMRQRLKEAEARPQRGRQGLRRGQAGQPRRRRNGQRRRRRG